MLFYIKIKFYLIKYDISENNHLYIQRQIFGHECRVQIKFDCCVLSLVFPLEHTK